MHLFSRMVEDGDEYRQVCGLVKDGDASQREMVLTN
jgi:hypothetical protein